MIKYFCSLIEKLDRQNQLMILKKNASISLKGKIKFGNYTKFIIYPKIEKVVLGDKLNIRNSVHIIVQDHATLEIEDNVFMNNFCSINCLDYIKIGENTLFGENVKLYDHNHQYKRTDTGLEVSHSEFSTAPIIIGKNCWLGSNVTVLKGVTIGDNCIIGAGCVIYKDIPANSTVINHQNLNVKTNE